MEAREQKQENGQDCRIFQKEEARHEKGVNA
jgi:hypothetical protein